MKRKKYILTISLIIGIALLYSRCINSFAPGTGDIRGNEYAGSSSCLQCHKDVNASYQHSAHFQTSWSVSAYPEKIPMTTDSFIFNKTTKLTIQKLDSGIYQVASIKGSHSITKRFEIGFGSGEKAFSFGYWEGKNLYQLPLSYFRSIHGWANSPGFPMEQPYFTRPIIRRCFECHSSYISEDVEQLESLTHVRKLEKQSIIYGIDCERCHGPAADHVGFHIENPSVKDARFIKSWVALSRQQKLDACSVCHSGNDRATQKSTFSFKPGDTLSNYYYPEIGASISATPDVHGKQAQVLASSRCFQKSATMECSSCHSIHEDNVPYINNYSKQCLRCHQKPEHKHPGVNDMLNNAIVADCIECHMPKEASRLISFQELDKPRAGSYLLRTHRIAIYTEETKKIIALAKKANQLK